MDECGPTKRNAGSRAKMAVTLVGKPRRIAATCLAVMLLTGAAQATAASTPASWDVRAAREGVTLRARVLRDRVRFCIDAAQDLKVSAQYGVELKAPADERMLWAEALPKVVTGPGWYFGLPLQIDLTTAGTPRERHVHLDLGACSSAKQMCSSIVFDVVLPPYRDGGHPSGGCAQHVLRP